MNWVGGSRNRFVVKNDAKKQREFFEKRKMQQKLKNLGIALPASPRGTSSGSMDLMTLFIVNQIAAKKENKDTPKVAVLSSTKTGSKHKRNEPLVLPMSPCSPSQLCLVEGQPQYSIQVTRNRKHVIPQGFKCRQLSPVLESAFSDNSASDYLPPITDPLSPFSSSTSASSGQVNLGQKVSTGMFPLQRSKTQLQLSPHYTSGMEQTKFQPFSQPRGMTDCIPWSCGSNRAPYQPETPTAARVLLRSPEPDKTEAHRDQARHEVAFCLNQPEDKEPMLDFTLNQSEAEQQFEGDVFRGFSTEECEREAGHFGRGNSKIYLKDETPAPQTVPDPQRMVVEGSDHIHLSNCTDMHFSCLEYDNGPMNDCEYSPSYSCSGGYRSSDSNDDEECCQPCLQAASSYMDQACCADSLNPNQGTQHTQENPKQRHTKPRPPTPLQKPKMNCREINQKVMENVSFQVKALESNSRQTGSNTAQCASPQALAQTPSSELCKCKRTSSETRDAGTQTADSPAAETHHASTQCSLVADGATEATGFKLWRPPVDVSVRHPATGRRTDTAAEPGTRTPLSGEARSGEKHTPWTKKKSTAGFLPGSSITNKCTANNSDGKVILQRPRKPFPDAPSMTDVRGKKNREGRDERGQQENGRLITDLWSEVREEVTSATRANRLSEEGETLQEIADILLMLKQRKEVRK
ncbi:hypothetical protein EPR50_G00232700 [Perca flavescens]|uniref:Uncharacterized protein n=1 Tax=Perca flavescens TaxID=8167 RepID=A0A484C591_PERFV|nr:uncharacterized protein C12orf40 homolog [Perca flavescens]TDG96794.1 hypothetical protein EPR50_G00232700 [Perca flavescens]